MLVDFEDTLTQGNQKLHLVLIMFCKRHWLTNLLQLVVKVTLIQNSRLSLILQIINENH